MGRTRWPVAFTTASQGSIPFALPFDLVDENHRIARDHASKGEHAEATKLRSDSKWGARFVSIAASRNQLPEHASTVSAKSEPRTNGKRSRRSVGK
jgi:hypothetical protein